MSFSNDLLAWYDRHARVLPWRIGPHDTKRGIRANPYHVWLSEVMLQQTTVAAVKAYFEKFITIWPTVDGLAAAREEHVMAAWAGLGYYSRARNLKACAQIVSGEFGGHFPETAVDLRKLPGIGDYTSAAIAAIAFGEAAPVVDGNIERVVTRQTADATPLPKAKSNCTAFMVRETPKERPGDFVQAMMDLGATICTPKNPACAICPVFEPCEARKAGTMLDFPVKAPKKAKPNRKGAVFVLIRSDGFVWTVQRPHNGLLGGMAALPTTDWTARQDGATGVGSAPFEARWTDVGTVKHTFTHFHLELEVWGAKGDTPESEGRWNEPNVLPTVFRKAAQAAQKMGGP
ncbi:MAG: A/G-specific adenine glycosylase [Ahrensia sp.]|nr:A/G-specific adenine glycosylase [Ahrensia sp.]